MKKYKNKNNQYLNKTNKISQARQSIMLTDLIHLISIRKNIMITMLVVNMKISMKVVDIIIINTIKRKKRNIIVEDLVLPLLNILIALVTPLDLKDQIKRK